MHVDSQPNSGREASEALKAVACATASTGTDPDHEDAVQVPPYELVFHDAVVTTYPANNLRGHAKFPDPESDAVGRNVRVVPTPS